MSEQSQASKLETKSVLLHLYSFGAVAVEGFIAAEKFVEGKTVDGVSIAWLGPDIKKFIKNKKREICVGPAELKIHKLLVEAGDLPDGDNSGIITELDGKHKIMSAHLHDLLAHKQRTREFSSVVAYIPCDEDDGNAVLWAVHAYWRSLVAGWYILGRIVSGPYIWHAGFQVVSL
ncbi:MAG: hypothetical protein WCW36_01215 [Candidatus Paceibacterota bacterium]|jgi:hypothetical protein